MLEVFHYPKCGTCKKALKWLDARGVEYRLIDIVAKPPSLSKLKLALKQSGLPVAKFFNTSGQSYRTGNFKAKLDGMTEAQALEALGRDGKLIKRPLVFGDGFVLVGFREADYAARV
ncbi:MAG TPA: arsenate reductase family protein [Polyangiaceae bacterium]